MKAIKKVAESDPREGARVRTVPISPYFTAKEHARFRAKYERRDEGHSTECWMWLGSKTLNGYGTFHTSRAGRLAHRVSYTRNVGPIPEGLALDHRCRNRACVNPYHLEPVSVRENTLRGEGESAVQAASDRCRNGHLYDEENTYRHPNRGRRCRKCHKAECKRRRALQQQPQAQEGDDGE